MKPKPAALVLAFIPALSPFVTNAQSKIITGTIKNAQGEPVSGASILKKGSAKGTSSDEKGSFQMDAAPFNMEKGGSTTAHTGIF